MKEEMESIEFYKSKKGLPMHQRRYAIEILKKFEMENYNAVISLAEPMLQLSNNKDEQDVIPSQYMRLVGSLHYLCNMRPDLTFSVGIMSRFMERPKMSHLEAIKRILRYVKGSIGSRNLFPLIDKG